MGKKHKQRDAFEASSTQISTAEEFLVIKHDLWRVLILNAVYLIAVLVVYFTNNRAHYLESWFGRVFHF